MPCFHMINTAKKSAARRSGGTGVWSDDFLEGRRGAGVSERVTCAFVVVIVV